MSAPVHDHGPTEGRGLGCPERRLPDGRLVGACIVTQVGTFVAAGPRSAKLRCEVCGATGHPEGPWMAKHLTHDERCPDCGAQLSNRGALAQHRRQHH